MSEDKQDLTPEELEQVRQFQLKRYTDLVSNAPLKLHFNPMDPGMEAIVVVAESLDSKGEESTAVLGLGHREGLPNKVVASIGNLCWQRCRTLGEKEGLPMILVWADDEARARELIYSAWCQCTHMDTLVFLWSNGRQWTEFTADQAPLEWHDVDYTAEDTLGEPKEFEIKTVDRIDWDAAGFASTPELVARVDETRARLQAMSSEERFEKSKEFLLYLSSQTTEIMDKGDDESFDYDSYFLLATYINNPEVFAWMTKMTMGNFDIDTLEGQRELIEYAVSLTRLAHRGPQTEDTPALYTAASIMLGAVGDNDILEETQKRSFPAPKLIQFLQAISELVRGETTT